MTALKVLSFSSLFPNEAQPGKGIFLLHRLAHLAQVDGINVRMVAPVPWFPSTNPAFGRYSAFARAPRQSEQRGIAVVHPRYPAVPKVGMTVTPALMAAAVLPIMLAMRRNGFDFDVIDAYYLFPDGVAAALLGWLLNRPVLQTAFGTDVNLIPRHAAARGQLLWAVNKAAGVTAVCEALKDRLIALGADSDKIRVIVHGVDRDLFKPPADRKTLRARLGFVRPTLISVGHLIKRKGHDRVIAALRLLPGTDLVIAGAGPEASELRRLAADLGVAERVRFAGLVPQNQLPDLVGAADALVLCSDREGMANVLLEALACGTPIAATPVWGTPEVMTTPAAGVLLRDREPESVAEGVRQLLANPPNRAVTERHAEQFSWPKAAAQHAALIRAVTAAEPQLRGRRML
jgi:teichuronic acid biosynthesis glycosyltransferase TuaC